MDDINDAKRTPLSRGTGIPAIFQPGWTWTALEGRLSPTALSPIHGGCPQDRQRPPYIHLKGGRNRLLFVHHSTALTVDEHVDRDGPIILLSTLRNVSGGQDPTRRTLVSKAVHHRIEGRPRRHRPRMRQAVNLHVLTPPQKSLMKALPCSVSTSSQPNGLSFLLAVVVLTLLVKYRFSSFFGVSQPAS